jgi:hypothetical protein
MRCAAPLKDPQRKDGGGVSFCKLRSRQSPQSTKRASCLWADAIFKSAGRIQSSCRSSYCRVSCIVLSAWGRWQLPDANPSRAWTLSSVILDGVDLWVNSLKFGKYCNFNGNWLPFLDTYRTMCRATEPDFRRILESIRELRFAA